MIPKFIENELTNEYLKQFLKKYKVTTSQLKRADLLNSLYSLENSGEITTKELWDFVANVYKYGYNRIIMTNLISVSSVSAVMSRDTFEKKLETEGEPVGYLNLFSSLDGSERFNDHTLLFQDVVYTEQGRTKLLNRCYCKTDWKMVTDMDGNPSRELVRIFTWTQIDFINRRVTVHTRNHGFNPLHVSLALKSINQSFISLLKKSIDFEQLEVLHEKETLFKIYKEMTDTAEKPFKEKVERVAADFEAFYKAMNRKLEYDGNKDNIKLLDRMIRLYERGLITQNYQLYSKYYNGKLGVVQKIVFCDSTGANVSAEVKEITENISNYEIYFDTRDTLDERRSLDKLWAIWYYKPNQKRVKRDYKVKFEVHESFYVTHFLGSHLLEEVANYVFSKFGEFEK